MQNPKKGKKNDVFDIGKGWCGVIKGQLVKIEAGGGSRDQIILGSCTLRAVAKDGRGVVS